jgi:hypothetical protein
MKHYANLINKQTQGKFTLTEVTSNSPDISIKFRKDQYFLIKNKENMKVLGIIFTSSKRSTSKNSKYSIK